MRWLLLLSLAACATWDPVWSFDLLMGGCDIRTSLWVRFDGEDPNLTELQPGLGEFHEVHVSVQPYAMTSTWEGDGQLRVTEVGDGTASGHLEGRVEVTLRSILPPMVATGQTVTVEALAFRELPVEPTPAMPWARL